MNRLSKLLPPANVVVDGRAADKAAALDLAAALFATGGLDRARVRASLEDREALGSTGLGQGVAIPHGRLRGLRHAVAAVLRLHDAVPFDAPDGQPVGLLVALLVPENARQEHLELLSELAQMLSDRDLRAALMAEASAPGLLRLISAWAPIRPAA